MDDTVVCHISMLAVMLYLVHQCLSKQSNVQLSIILYYKVPWGLTSSMSYAPSYIWEIFGCSYHMLGTVHL